MTHEEDCCCKECVPIVNVKVAYTLHRADICLVEIEQLRFERDRYREALELIATPKRPDGTYNRSREACEILAKEALK